MNGRKSLSVVVGVCMFLLILSGPVWAVTHYVSPSQSIQAAIDGAANGDEIEVAPGTYYEVIDFKGKGVRLYSSGGRGVTTIHGNWNNYHVVKCVSGEDANTILEGFTITGGKAYGFDWPDFLGAGMLNSGSNPTVTNCFFYLNAAFGGGGMFNHYANPTVTNCTFSNNYASSGGGMYNYDNSSPTVLGCLFYRNATSDGQDYEYPRSGLHGNHGGHARHGAGMYNDNSSPIVSGCDFIENRTGKGGKGQKGSDGGAYESGGWGGDGGYGGLGAGMYNYWSSPTVTDCNFRLNVTGNGGVAGHGGNSNDYCYLGDCHGGKGGAGGHAGHGAGMYNHSSSPVVINCEFTDNRTGVGGWGGNGGNSYCSELYCPERDWAHHTVGSGGDGGKGGCGAGIYNEYSSLAVTNCICRNNVTGDGGIGGHQGELHRECYPAIGCFDVPLPGDASHGGDGGDGAGIYSLYSEPNVTNCTFSSNKTGVGGEGGYGGETEWGGCGYVDCGTPGIRGLGGGICSAHSTSTVSNCILWGDIPSEIYNANSTTAVTYSDVQWGQPGMGNISGYPVFVDMAHGDLRLTACSPCIDAGDNTAVLFDTADLDGDGNTSEPIPFDLTGNPRFIDDEGMPDTGFGAPPIVDMGAYESQLSMSPHLVRNVTKDESYCTIQMAIDDANDGDEIEVAPGTYYETIDFKGKAVHLYSSGGPEVTTIDGDEQYYHVIQCVSGEDNNTILEGFTITGGNASGSWPDYYGGGMYITDSSPTVKKCIFRGNSAEYGGGMYNYGDSTIVSNCVFWANTAGSGGGAIYNRKNLTITNCTFSGNSVTGGKPGISVGGAIQNSAFHGAPLVVTNCIFWGNTPDQIDYVWHRPIVSYSCVQDGWPPPGHPPNGGTANIDADPRFVNMGYWGDANDPNIIVEPSDPNAVWVDADYHLAAGSPCIDAGDPNYAAEPNETDLDGNPRVLGGRIDMGAYEFTFLMNTAPVSCIEGGDRVVEAGVDCQVQAVLDGSCSSDADSTAGTNDDINDFDWYEVIDVCDPNSDIWLGSGEVIECNLGLGECLIILEVTDKAGAFDVNGVSIVVEDRMPPVIALNGSATVVLECGVETYLEEGAAATDNCDDSVTVVIGGDAVDTTTCGMYVVTYDATDDWGNAAEQITRDVIVQDTTGPVITLNGSEMVVLECGIDSYVEEGATATDNCDDAVAVVIGGDVVDTLTCGMYVVTYDASDDWGNAAEQVVREVIVEDTIPPQFTLSVSPDVLWPPNNKMVLVMPAWEVSDNCDESPEVSLVDVTMNAEGNMSDDVQIGGDGSIYLRARKGKGRAVRIYTLTYQAVDDSGNAAIESATVVVPRDQRKL